MLHWFIVLPDGFQPSIKAPATSVKVLAPRRFVGFQTPSFGGDSSLSEKLFLTSTQKFPSGDEDETTRRDRSISDVLEDLGQSFKNKAQEMKHKSQKSTGNRSGSIFYALTSSIFYLLFIFYRSYRGIFILSPAVFKRVYSSFENTLASDFAFTDESGSKDNNSQIVTWRTRITVTILATTVTLSYFVGGVTRVVTKFFRTATKTSSLPESFEAAADETMNHESRIRKHFSDDSTDQLF